VETHVPDSSECDCPGFESSHSRPEAATPDTRLFQHCRWQAEGQRNILVHEGLSLLGAEDHRMDVAGWLQGLGLERYETLFHDNEIDWEVLPRLTSEDLKEIGVVAIGHRRKLLDAIAALGAETPAPVTAAPRDAPAQADAERRQLTVMFCDLVGSTALSSRLDPEDLREVIAAYHRTVANLVRSFDGFVAKYMGDGVLIYFGYPRAHEDDAERAVRAGLGVIDAVGRLDVKSIELQARVGIATGLVVVGDLIGEGSAQEQSVVGETPNLAARLQALAEPDAVVIAAGTRLLVGDLFEYCDLGAVEVKGVAGPVPAWRALRPSAVASRFEALRGAALTRLIGRDEEIDLLLRRWARAKAGDGQVVLTPARLASASRASPRHWRSASTPSHISACAISARPITRTARYSRSSTSSAGQPGSRATTCPLPGWRSSKPCWFERRRRIRMWHSSPICCHCPARSATTCRTSLRSARRSGPWRR
jgi:class 3 adenylate cyclase